LEKAFEHIELAEQLVSEDRQSSHVTLNVVFGGLGGNFSQLMSNFVPAMVRPKRRVAYADKNNVVLVLHPGEHHIVAPIGTRCGLLPLGTQCRKITTKGLKWELGTWMRSCRICNDLFKVCFYS